MFLQKWKNTCFYVLYLQINVLTSMITSEVPVYGLTPIKTHSCLASPKMDTYFDGKL